MIHEIIITVAKFIQELPQTESFRATGLSEENLSCLGQFQGSHGTTGRKYRHTFSFRGTFGTKETILVVNDESQ